MKVQIGTVGVDAGMLMVGDPCYFVGKDATINERCNNWKQACDDIFCKDGVDRDEGMDVYRLGVAVSTTYGDGEYKVFLETTKAGKRRLVVNLD